MLSGCSTSTTGYRVSEETVAFIQPGVTTRAEVIENLGPPLLELPDLRVLAYSWGKVRLTGGKPTSQERWTGSPATGYASPPPLTEDATAVESRRWVFCIALDEKGRVVRHGTLELEGARSLEKAVREWAESSEP